LSSQKVGRQIDRPNAEVEINHVNQEFASARQQAIVDGATAPGHPYAGSRPLLCCERTPRDDQTLLRFDEIRDKFGAASRRALVDLIGPLFGTAGILLTLLGVASTHHNVVVAVRVPSEMGHDMAARPTGKT
jgi:hypothetical protein